MDLTKSTVTQALERSGYPATSVVIQTLSSSAARDVVRVTLHDETQLVAKITDHSTADVIEKERAGLMALAESSFLHTPKTHPVLRIESRAILLMEALTPTRDNTDCTWEDFGRALALHHTQSREIRYGWDHDNHIGPTPQRNTWCHNWIEFNRTHRLGFQLKRAQSRGLLRAEEADLTERVIDRLDTFIPAAPPPALLHGDLWSGNALCTEINGATRIALIDPAVSVGDPLADIAMMKLFGGFPESCFTAYFEVMQDTDRTASRVLVYQLYHMLNHLNIFGRGYASSVVAIARDLLQA